MINMRDRRARAEGMVDEQARHPWDYISTPMFQLSGSDLTPNIAGAELIPGLENPDIPLSNAEAEFNPAELMLPDACASSCAFWQS